MADALPLALVDLLREMRVAGVSIGGLREATGLSTKTIIKYTSGLTRLLCECGRPGSGRLSAARTRVQSPVR